MSAIEVIVNGALAAFGKVDILVNNADLLRGMMLLISLKMNGIVLFRLIRRWYSS